MGSGGVVLTHLRDPVSTPRFPLRSNRESRAGPILSRGTPTPLRVLKAVAFAGQFEDVAAVRQSVEGGPGQAFVAQHLGPVLEGQVRRRDHTRPLVGVADHVEEEFRGVRSTGG